MIVTLSCNTQNIYFILKVIGVENVNRALRVRNFTYRTKQGVLPNVGLFL